MTAACIVQARLNSTRLHAKVLLPLPTGRTVLEECLFQCFNIKGIDIVVLALSEDEDSNVIFDALRCKGWSETSNFAIIRGPEQDVLGRYLKAAEAVKADIVMRVTSDCPLIDPVECAWVLAYREIEAATYYCNNMPRKVPHGWDCEVFPINALRVANSKDDDPKSREHVTQWLREKSGYPICNVPPSSGCCEDRSHICWTLDEPKDYPVIWNEFMRRLR